MKNWFNFNIRQDTYYPTSVKDVVSTKYDTLHKILYNNALTLAIIDNVPKYFELVHGKPEYEENIIKCYIDDDGNISPIDSFDTIDDEHAGYIDLLEWRIYEDDSNAIDFYDPTTAVFMRKLLRNKEDGSLEYTKFSIDLSDYWNNKYNIEFLSKPEYLPILDYEYPFNDIVKYDYVRERAKIENRVDNKIRWIKFSEISTDDEIKTQSF